LINNDREQAAIFAACFFILIAKLHDHFSLMIGEESGCLLIK